MKINSAKWVRNCLGIIIFFNCMKSKHISFNTTYDFISGACAKNNNKSCIETIYTDRMKVFWGLQNLQDQCNEYIKLKGKWVK